MNYKSISILSIIDELANEPGKLAKIEILEKYKNHPELKPVLFACYNPFLTYHIKKIPEYKLETRFEGIGLRRAVEMLTLFVKRRVTGNAAIKKLVSILESLHADDAEILCRVIKKDMRAGFSASTINKVWPGYIPKHCYMGAVAFKQSVYDKMPWDDGVVSQVKENGMFCSYDFAGDEEKALAFTRKGKSLDFQGAFDKWFEHASHYLRVNHPEYANIGRRLDGEMLVLKEGEPLESVNYEERSVGNGVAGKAEKGTLSVKDSQRLRYVVWDFVNLKEAYQGLSPEPYISRFSVLHNIVDYANRMVGYSLVRMVESKVCKSKEEAQCHYVNVVQRGLEGTILKHRNHPWKDGKPTTQMKLKVFADVELRVTGYNESEKNPGTLASFTCESECGKLSVNVGSGYTKEQVETFWTNRKKFIGQILTTQFCELTTNQNGGLSLANPVFIEVRLDKSVANTYPEIVEEYEAKTGVKAKVGGGKEA